MQRSINVSKLEKEKSNRVVASSNNFANGTNLLKAYDELYERLSSEVEGYLIIEPGIYDLSIRSFALMGNIHLIGADGDFKPIIRSRVNSFDSATVNNQSRNSITIQNLEIENYDKYYTNPALASNSSVFAPIAASVWRSFSVNPCAYKFSKSDASHRLIDVDFISRNEQILALEIGQSIKDSSTYINCTSNTQFSFGAVLKSCLGYYENCTVANFGSFGSYTENVKGVFKNCSAKNYSFGYAAENLEGAFSNCQINIANSETGEGFGTNSKNNKGFYENCKIVKDA
jgi:hypothetical protein